MKKLLLTFGFVCLMVFSCSKFQSDDFLGPVSPDLFSHSSNSSSISLASSNVIKANVISIIETNFYMLDKIATSTVSLESIPNMTDADLVAEKVFTYRELDSLKSILNIAGAKLKEKLKGIEVASDCSECGIVSVEKLEKLKTIIGLLRDPTVDYRELMKTYMNKLADMEFPSSVPLTTVEDSESGGPDCSVGFYICLVGCSGATSGIGAAACVYVCACAFCELKPPGC